jgi:hypothetical protein
MPFNFDLNLSPETNIEKFYDYMATVDKDFAEILRKELPKLIPVPEGQTQRQSARLAFASEVAKFLDATPKAVTK